MSKEHNKESKDHHKESKSSLGHGLHLHLPSKKTGRSQSSGRISPISFLTGHRKHSAHNNNGHSGNGNGASGNGSGGTGTDYGDGGGGGEPRRSSSGSATSRYSNGGGTGSGSLGRKTLSNPPSSHVSPMSSPKASRKGSSTVQSQVCKLEATKIVSGLI